MARTDNLNHYLTDIANSIRANHKVEGTYKVLRESYWGVPVDTGIVSRGDLKIQSCIGPLQWINANTYFYIWGCDISTYTTDPYSGSDTTKRLNNMEAKYSGGTGSGYSGITIRRSYNQETKTSGMSGFYYNRDTTFELDRGKYYYYSNSVRNEDSNLTFTDADFSSDTVGATIFISGSSYYSPKDEVVFYRNTNANLPIKTFKVWDADGNLIGDFVPCYRDSDNVYGFYDRVDNVFHPNYTNDTIRPSDVSSRETGEVITTTNVINAKDFDKYTKSPIRTVLRSSSMTSVNMARNLLDFDAMPQLTLNVQGFASVENLLSNLFYENLPRLVGTSNVSSFASLYYNCTKVKSIDLSNLDTSSARIFSSMFYSCTSLESIQFPTKGFPAITNLNYGNGNFSNMFRGCSSLKELDLSTFNLPNTGTSGYFPSFANFLDGCSSLDKITLPSSTIPAQDISAIFCGCKSLPESYIKAFLNKLSLKSNPNFYMNFYECYLLENLVLDLDPMIINTNTYLTFDSTFYGCHGLKSISITTTKPNAVSFAQTFYMAFTGSSRRGESLEEEVFKVDISIAPSETNSYISNLSSAFSYSAGYRVSHTSGTELSDSTLEVDFHNTEFRVNSPRPFQYCQAKKLKVSNIRSGTTNSYTVAAAYFFNNTYAEEIYIDNWDFGQYGSNVSYMFYNNNTYLKKVVFENCTETSVFSGGGFNYFIQASHLEFLDIRCFILSGITSTPSNAFNSVPANCEIIVKDDTEKAWMNTKFPNLTNVKTVAEYEAQ